MCAAPKSPTQLLLALGSNLGDRHQWLLQAKDAIRQSIGEITAQAQVYETAPVGAADQPFLNSALTVATTLSLPEAMTAVLAIEKSLGRTRNVHWGNRTIDIDILLAQSQGVALTASTDALVVPHPRMLERDFVLVPACDVASDWVHPQVSRTLGEVLAQKGFKL